MISTNHNLHFCCTDGDRIPVGVFVGSRSKVHPLIIDRILYFTMNEHHLQWVLFASIKFSKRERKPEKEKESLLPVQWGRSQKETE
ncbi:hypothetical protein LWM68_20190 [Niabella sp. W65]|nr:hypothetical protein [Niabella sp. W65]MCH7364877.1 hypothetical protein [Niabella sp. W65]